MITRLLISSVAVVALTVGAASAHTHKARHARSMTFAAPAQPIPYAQLDHYLRASPRERRSIEMAAANTGATANTAATTSTDATATTDTTGASGATPEPMPPPPAAMPDNGAVNPPVGTTMGGAAGGGSVGGGPRPPVHPN